MPSRLTSPTLINLYTSIPLDASYIQRIRSFVFNEAYFLTEPNLCLVLFLIKPD